LPLGVFFTIVLLQLVNNDAVGAGWFGVAMAGAAIATYLAPKLRAKQEAARSQGTQKIDARPGVRLSADAEAFRKALRIVWELRAELSAAESESAFFQSLAAALDALTDSTVASPAALSTIDGIRSALDRMWMSLQEGPLVVLNPGAVSLGGRKAAQLAARINARARSAEGRERDLRESFEQAFGMTFEVAFGAMPSERLAERLVAAAAPAIQIPSLDQLLRFALDDDPSLGETVARHLADLRDVAMDGLRLRFVPDPSICWDSIQIFVPEKVYAILGSDIEGYIPRNSIVIAQGITSIFLFAAARNIPLRALTDYDRMREALTHMSDDERRRIVEYPSSLCVRRIGASVTRIGGKR
jgi:hypothetical protein